MTPFTFPLCLSGYAAHSAATSGWYSSSLPVHAQQEWGRRAGEEALTFVGDVLGLSDAQSAEATEGKFSNLAAHLITDLVGIV